MTHPIVSPDSIHNISKQAYRWQSGQPVVVTPKFSQARQASDDFGLRICNDITMVDMHLPMHASVYVSNVVKVE